ncbi:MAG: ATPase, T2SS/T4P/T4SS family, partial [Rhodocyclaceae bacterium]|nr:ATPase, T2SS/T4P/T4SS family [Rhodocyclaceae bacterium]
MNAVLNPGSGQGSGDPVSARDLGSRLAFFKNLQAVTNKIHATANIDEIMLELSQDVCALFNADRLTVYALSEDKTSIVSKVKTGLNSFRDLKLPIADQSIGGYVALSKKTINIRDVYDEAELMAINPGLRFLQEVDRRTGYRTKQMLVAPITDAQTHDLLGVVQIINNKAGVPFAAVAEEGVKSLSETLAIAFAQRSKPAQTIKTKYDHLVLDAVVSAHEMERATSAARKKGLDVEEVLITEFQVKPPAIGAALAKFFGVPYEPYKPERIKPLDLMKNLRREYVEQNLWLPVEESAEGIVILCLDPEQVKSSRVVNNIFSRSKIVYRVTTIREFKQTVGQFFGGGFTDDTNVGDLLSAMDEGEIESDSGSDDVSAASDNELVKLVNKVIIDAYQQGASDIHIEPGMGKDRVLIRLRKDGALSKYIEIPASFRQAIVARIKIMCDLDISEKRRPQDGKIKFKKFGPLD